MYAAGTCVERYMLAKQDDRFTIQEWMATKPFFHVDARKKSERFANWFPTGFRFEMAHQIVCHQQDMGFCVFSVTKFLNEILVGGMDCDRQVSWYGPWGSSPDHDRSFSCKWTGMNRKFDID